MIGVLAITTKSSNDEEIFADISSFQAKLQILLLCCNYQLSMIILKYPWSTESLEAIVVGFSSQQDDILLDKGGSWIVRIEYRFRAWTLHT